MDKTATYVARNGDAFEAKVADNMKNNPQFAFMRSVFFIIALTRSHLVFRPGNAFYAYYQSKIREVRREEGIATAGDAELVENAAEMRLQIKKAMLGELPVEDEAGGAKKKQVKVAEAPLEPPAPEEWSVFFSGTSAPSPTTLPLPAFLSHPRPFVLSPSRIIEKPTIPAVQDDILKLTAQFVARNGRIFQNGLLARESNVRPSLFTASIFFHFFFLLFSQIFL